MKCSNCKHSHTIEVNNKLNLICRRYPPMSILVPMQDIVGNQVLSIQPARPPVAPDDSCGEFMANLFNIKESKLS